MDATERAIAHRNGGPRPMTAGQLRRKEADMATKATKTTARKPAAKKAAAKEAPERHTNKGATCSVRGCSFPASRRGLCSGKGTNRHYRKALAAEKDAASK
jgi:hypothetical protein